MPFKLITRTLRRAKMLRVRYVCSQGFCTFSALICPFCYRHFRDAEDSPNHTCSQPYGIYFRGQHTSQAKYHPSVYQRYTFGVTGKILPLDLWTCSTLDLLRRTVRYQP